MWRTSGISLIIAMAMVSPGSLASAGSNADTEASFDPRSIYEISPLEDGAIIALSSLGVLVPAANASKIIDERCPCDPNEVGEWDRTVIGKNDGSMQAVSDGLLVASAVAPALLDWSDLRWSRPFQEDMVVFGEVLAVNGALRSLARYTIQRPRPQTYAGDPNLIPSSNGYGSFFSGHVSMTFASLSAAAVTLNLRHQQKIWPWVLTGAIGATVAVGRVVSGQHFYSDVIVGAVAGTLVGTIVPLRHWRGKKELMSGSLFVNPLPEGALIGWRTVF